MSTNLVAHHRIECDGDGRWPCVAFYEASSVCWARETRAEAKNHGWETNVSNRYGRRRLDFCPKHAANQQDL